MRRGAECWLSADGAMGLRKRHVTITRGSHVSLFINSQKNDVYAEGHTVESAWVSGSGIPISAIIARYFDLLEAHNIPEHAPFFCPTKRGSNNGYFHFVEGTYYNYSHC
eukprot:3939546-Rhodomonas_salina.1